MNSKHKVQAAEGLGESAYAEREQAAARKKQSAYLHSAKIYV